MHRYIKRIKPDILCFQEISFWDKKIQIQDILYQEGYKFFYYKSGEWNQREEGLLTASVHKITKVQDYMLPCKHAYNDFQRILTKSIILYNGKKLNVYNTHLAYHQKSSGCRINQIKYILDVINSENTSRDYIVFCGDLNEDPKDGYVYKQVVSNHHIKLNDTWIEPDSIFTFCESNKFVDPKLGPNRRIDFIFTSNNLPLYSRRCMDTRDGFGFCSDHYGVIASEIGNGGQVD